LGRIIHPDGLLSRKQIKTRPAQNESKDLFHEIVLNFVDQEAFSKRIFTAEAERRRGFDNQLFTPLHLCGKVF
jgi:hypothetical protein